MDSIQRGDEARTSDAAPMDERAARRTKSPPPRIVLRLPNVAVEAAAAPVRMQSSSTPNFAPIAQEESATAIQPRPRSLAALAAGAGSIATALNKPGVRFMAMLLILAVFGGALIASQRSKKNESATPRGPEFVAEAQTPAYAPTFEPPVIDLPTVDPTPEFAYPPSGLEVPGWPDSGAWPTASHEPTLEDPQRPSTDPRTTINRLEELCPRARVTGIARLHGSVAEPTEHLR